MRAQLLLFVCHLEDVVIYFVSVNNPVTVHFEVHSEVAQFQFRQYTSHAACAPAPIGGGEAEDPGVFSVYVVANVCCCTSAVLP